MRDLNPEQVRGIIEATWRLNTSAIHSPVSMDEVRALAQSWLAQGEALAAAQRERESWEREANLNELQYVAHRVAAAILVGTLVSKQPEQLEWAEASARNQPEPHVADATRLIVADVRLYDDGKAHLLADELAAALASLSNTDSGSEATTAGRDTPNKPGDLAGGVVARTPRTKGTE